MPAAAGVWERTPRRLRSSSGPVSLSCREPREKATVRALAGIPNRYITNAIDAATSTPSQDSGTRTYTINNHAAPRGHIHVTQQLLQHDPQTRAEASQCRSTRHNTPTTRHVCMEFVTTSPCRPWSPSSAWTWKQRCRGQQRRRWQVGVETDEVCSRRTAAPPRRRRRLLWACH